ncbi:DNA topoisomerase IB [Alteraurantiacibacter buctensis]|uniref:DNA topoisomerase n=1 Tax=Alteraurantiacibacter buctensis TaxID=1503981 RepID=A0A844YWJ4_9SPHN|nr:DNA topoisomerase IB [Alteraurantiacibacter buctensis]MXO71360.1 DNA topoisomerase IB [Alteraurantiacibacter buctensis]
MAKHSKALIFVDDDLPGITRRKSGHGWAYCDAKGERITDRAEIDRLNAIALPPAYTDAWFCPAPNGHILATGVDARGRKQYRYHPDFRVARESEKFDGCLSFGKLLPLVRRRVESDLTTRGMGRDKAIASVVRLLDLGALRIGNESYARANRSFGATTLRNRHAAVSGSKVLLKYRGKHGKLHEVTFTDKRLAATVRKMQDLPGQHLFQWLDDDAQCHEVNSTCVNQWLAETMGEPFTAKNFRTWHASVMGFRLLAGADGKVPLKSLLEDVAAHLGNTPAVTRKAYVHPAVIALVGEQEEWRESLQLPRATRWLDRYERGLLAHLEEAPAARELLVA